MKTTYMTALALVFEENTNNNNNKYIGQYYITVVLWQVDRKTKYNQLIQSSTPTNNEIKYTKITMINQY